MTTHTHPDKTTHTPRKGNGVKWLQVVVMGIFVVGLAVGVAAADTQLSVESQAVSGCKIITTPEGPGCWCQDGGWQWHCGGSSCSSTETSSCSGNSGSGGGGGGAGGGGDGGSGDSCGAWCCGRVTASPATQASFNAVWCEGEAQWRYERSEATDYECGGSMSSKRSDGCGEEVAAGEAGAASGGTGGGSGSGGGSVASGVCSSQSPTSPRCFGMSFCTKVDGYYCMPSGGHDSSGEWCASRESTNNWTESKTIEEYCTGGSASGSSAEAPGLTPIPEGGLFGSKDAGDTAGKPVPVGAAGMPGNCQIINNPYNDGSAAQFPKVVQCNGKHVAHCTSEADCIQTYWNTVIGPEATRMSSSGDWDPQAACFHFPLINPGTSENTRAGFNWDQTQSDANCKDLASDRGWVGEATGQLTSPFDGPAMMASVQEGRHAEGLDVVAPAEGAVVNAMCSGTVAHRSNLENPEMGYTIIDCDGGGAVKILHMNSVGVACGDRVTAGQPIGTIGTREFSHAHVEVFEVVNGELQRTDVASRLNTTSGVYVCSCENAISLCNKGAIDQSTCNDMYARFGCN